MPRFTLILTTILALAGCSDDFAPYSQLDRLRVLAIQAEPATPMPGQTTTLSALVFAPPGDSVATRWTWCPGPAPAAGNYACPLDQAQADQLFAPALDPSVAAALPSLELGTAATASLKNPFALTALASLCATGLGSLAYAQSFDCDGGFPLTVVLDVATARGSLRAGFVLRLPVGPTPELNQNPVLAGFELGGLPLAETPAPIVVAPEQTVDLRIDIPASASEIRSIPPAEGAPGQRPERLTVSWFADSGTIDVARTAYIPGQTSLDETSRNRWTAPAAGAWPPLGRVEFIAVLRDDRGGVGWLARQATVGQAP